MRGKQYSLLIQLTLFEAVKITDVKQEQQTLHNLLSEFIDGHKADEVDMDSS